MGKLNIKKQLWVPLVIFLLILIIAFPDVSSAGVKRGLLISANVIVPSLFPFTVFVLFLVKSNVLQNNRFLILLLSVIGGYPIGAKLINELYNQKIVDGKSATTMLMYSVNAGPAFIISAIGKGVFNSYKIGVVLFFSHILPSFIFAALFSKKLKSTSLQSKNKNLNISVSNIFVESVADAAAAIIQICSFIIVFSSANSFIEYFSKFVPIIIKLSYFLEVTSAVTKIKNIIFVAFLFGFAGFSIWFQIFAIVKKVKINIFKFIIGRIAHGTLSGLFCYLLLKIFKVKISVFSNNLNYIRRNISTSIELSIALAVMIIMLLICIYSKNNSRKILDDML